MGWKFNENLQRDQLMKIKKSIHICTFNTSPKILLNLTIFLGKLRTLKWFNNANASKARTSTFGKFICNLLLELRPYLNNTIY